jgi:hypothetical protein
MGIFNGPIRIRTRVADVRVSEKALFGHLLKILNPFRYFFKGEVPTKFLTPKGAGKLDESYFF